MPEVITFEHEIKEISRQVLFEYEGKCRIKHYWDSHGNLVPFETDDIKDRVAEGKFQVVEVVREEKFEYIPQPIVFTSWELYCNGEKIESSIYRYAENSTCMSVKAVIGWG